MEESSKRVLNVAGGFNVSRQVRGDGGLLDSSNSMSSIGKGNSWIYCAQARPGGRWTNLAVFVQG